MNRPTCRHRFGADGILIASAILCVCLASNQLLAAPPIPVAHETAAFRLPNPPATNYQDAYGQSLDIDNNFAIVGNEGTSGGVTPSRAAYIYQLDTKQLIRTLAPTMPDDSGGDGFGSSVGISGNLAVVGARFEDVQTPGGVRFNAGAGHVYNLTTGQQIARLVASDPIGNDFLGQWVAIDGTTVLMGGFGDSIYKFNALTGQQLAKIHATLPNDEMHGPIALNGSTAVVAGHTAGTFAGAAFVLDMNTNQQVRKLVPADLGPNDSFGSGIDFQGNFAAIGSVFHDGPFADSGAAYVFDINTGAQLAEVFPPDHLIGAGRQNFGTSVAIDGNRLLVSAPIDDRHGTDTGAAFLFDWTNQSPLGEFAPSNMSATRQLGHAIAMRNGRALVSDMGTQARGTAYLFDTASLPEPSTALHLALGVSAFIWRPYRKGNTCSHPEHSR